MNEYAERLVLRYNPGQFTFRRYDAQATDEQLYALARQINAVQEDALHQVVKVRVLQLR